MASLKDGYYLDPSEHSNIQTTFMLPRGLKLQNLALCELGLTLNSATDTSRYPYIAGVLSTISRIYLYNNGQDLSKCLQVDKLCQVFTEDYLNEDNYSVHSNLDKNGFTFATKENINPVVLANAITTSSSTSRGGLVYLKKLLPFLNTPDSNYLFRGDVFSNARLVIYWNNIPANQLITGAAANDIVNFNRPVLSFEIINVDIPRPLAYKYYEYKLGSFFVDSMVRGATSTTQPINWRCSTFQNDYLIALYVLKVPSNQALASDLKYMRSLSFLNELIQVNMPDGTPLITYGGLSNSIGRVGPTKDLYLGNMNAPITCNTSPHGANSADFLPQLLGLEGIKFQSNMSITKIDINRQIDGLLQVIYQRDSITTAATANDMTDMNMSFNLTLVGVVSRFESGNGKITTQ